MIERGNFGKNGQTSVRNTMASGRNVSARVTSEKELIIAQQSLYLLKSKMVKSTLYFGKNFALDQKNLSMINFDTNFSKNSGIRKAQTYTQENSYDSNEYDNSRDNKSKGNVGKMQTGQQSKGNYIAPTKSSSNNQNFNKKGPLNSTRDEEYDQQDRFDSGNQNKKTALNSKNTNQKATNSKKRNEPSEDEDEYNTEINERDVDEIPIGRNKKQDNNDDNDEYEGQPDENAELIMCSEGCGRKFVEASLVKHEKICRKIFLSKRKKFDMAAQRLTDENGDPIVNIKKVQAIGKEKPKKNEAEKVPKWKLQSAMLRTQLKKSKGEDVSNTEEAKLVKDFEKQDCITCPHCGRNFNENAGARHIISCAERAKAGKVKAPAPKPSNGKVTSATMKEPLSKTDSLSKTMTPAKKDVAPKKK
jgi:hypothetical protein